MSPQILNERSFILYSHKLHSQGNRQLVPTEQYLRTRHTLVALLHEPKTRETLRLDLNNPYLLEPG